MNTSRLWRTICLPLWWEYADLECATDSALQHFLELLREDPTKQKAVKWFWARTVLDDDEWRELPRERRRKGMLRLKKRATLLPQIIKHCPALQEVDIDFTLRAGVDLALALASRADTLASLTIANNQDGTPESWAARLLHQLPNLTFLRLDEVNATPDAYSLGLDLGRAIASLSKLITLQLWECQPLDHHWAELPWQTKTLRAIALDQCDNLSDVGLDALLARFSETLVELELDITPAGERGLGSPLEHIGLNPAPPYHFPNLENLILGRMYCTPLWIDRFSNLPNLCHFQFEELENCGLAPDLPPDTDNSREEDFMASFENDHKWKTLRKLVWDSSTRDNRLETRLSSIAQNRGWDFISGGFDSDDEDGSSEHGSWEDTDISLD